MHKNYIKWDAATRRPLCKRYKFKRLMMQYVALFIRIISIYVFVRIVGAIPKRKYFIEEINEMRGGAVTVRW